MNVAVIGKQYRDEGAFGFWVLGQIERTEKKEIVPSGNGKEAEGCQRTHANLLTARGLCASMRGTCALPNGATSGNTSWTS